MKDAIAAALAGRAAIVLAESADSVVAVRNAPRESGMVLLVIAPTVPKLDRAMLIAALGPLAEELAPATRLAALDISEDALLEDLIAAADYLATAISTTGQLLRVTPR